jgi:hypothetical protein
VWLALVGLAACVDSASEYQCASASDCMIDGNAGRCEPTGHCSFADDSCGSMGYRYHASAGAQAGVCVLGALPVIEVPPFDFKDARDSVHSSCAPPAAKDVSFELDLPFPETIAIDTGAQSGEPVALSVHAGPCPTNMNELACGIQTCGPVPYTGLAVTVPPGTNCITVEQASTSNMNGVGLRVFHSGRAGVVLAPPAPPPQQTTCGSQPDPIPPSCGAATGDPSAVALLMMCPGPVQLSATVTPTFDVTVSLRQGFPPTELDCKTGSGAQTVHASSTMPGPYVISIDHAANPPACGTFDLAYTVTPQ